MSLKNRRNEYNRLVKLGREKDISPRLQEEFGKGKRNLLKTNKDEFEEEPEKEPKEEPEDE